ncbi:MAG: hypothetical protein Q4D51_09945 [Eubacteriales bacterium]|nr:hypothetical protein [Eubacteriales bacterium]
MKIVISTTVNMPIYEQITNQIRDAVVSGEPTAGLDPVLHDDFLRMLQSFVADYMIDMEHGVCKLRVLGEM